MLYRKTIIATTLALLLNNQAYSFSLAKVAQSASTAAASSSQQYSNLVGYRMAQAAFFLAAFIPLIESWQVFYSRKQFPPVNGNRLEFLQNICRNNHLDPKAMHLGLCHSQGNQNILSAAIGTDTILIDTAEMDNTFDQMLTNQKNKWENIDERTKQQEQKKIGAAKTIVTHEIGHLKKKHYYKEPMVRLLGYAATAFLLERYVHHKGFLKKWFEQPITTTGVTKSFLSYGISAILCYLLNEFFIFLPYSRLCEREADAYAITQARRPDDLEAIADRLEKLFQQRINTQRLRAGKKPVILGSFRERYLTNFRHPSFSERIAYFRAAAQDLRARQRIPAHQA